MTYVNILEKKQWETTKVGFLFVLFENENKKTHEGSNILILDNDS